MRDARARAEEALDDVSANLAEVLRRADVLLAEWSAFGAAVRTQVEREAATVGDAVANAVEGAVQRGLGASLERAVPEQLGARMAGLTAELTKLEHRARTAAKAISDDRVHDRRLLGGLVIGVLVANALLVLLLVRTPHPQVPSPEATRIVEPAQHVEPKPKTTGSDAANAPAALPAQGGGATAASDGTARSTAATRASGSSGTPEATGASGAGAHGAGGSPAVEPVVKPEAGSVVAPTHVPARPTAVDGSTTGAPRAVTRSNLPARKR